jgi:glycolate dehydrogenase FAD-linked subunit
MPALPVRDLAALVGETNVLVGEASRPYLTDATEAEGVSGLADAIVRPPTAESAAAVVEWCYTRGIPIVPRGGGTGYAGGCVPQGGGVVLSTELLTRTRSLDPIHWCAQVEAGVTTRRLQTLARENGLYFPVDPGAAEQSHVGGNVATNAGGPHAFKYGVMRAWVTGLEVIFAPGGQVTKLGSSVRKDVAGYDLVSLLAGSEGTLGVITAVDVRMIPAVAARYPVVAFFSSLEAGVEAMDTTLASGTAPSALEYLDGPTTEMARRSFPKALPEGVVLTLIAEADGSPGEATAGRTALLEALSPESTGVYAPTAPGEIEALWRWREGIGIAVDAAYGGKVSEDIAVPLQALAAAIEATLCIGESHGLTACSWGHAGDGNLHSTFVFDRTDARAVKEAKIAAGDLFELAIELGGTISGEHGLGMLKNGWLRNQWSQEAVALQEGIKSLFDPKCLLNPGKKES